ncbi:hypothetical protein KBY57_00140 [Cyanobium sp. Aljojuca 7D2]|uniref:hypothetical protein n=1 Tax=Cyanobium sp. Aljojuca 7D2 TaxID=2823698 RepID=UPI0020CE2CAA|nr:hypothetical protein [Cyanobium sp. Aljojuca 7D2]MCP9889466.1 hypothetical protein [Cyanobium sp. Aljojuca 7D2]
MSSAAAGTTAAAESTAAMASSSAVVEQRLYVLSGFDPRGAAPLHRLLKQVFPLGARPRQEGWLSRWPLEPAGAAAELAGEELVCLHWDDIARRHWPRQPLALLVDGWDLYKWYLGSGGFPQVARLAPGAAFTGLYPVLVVVLLAALAGAAAWLAGGIGGVWWALAAAGVVLVLGWQLAERLAVGWLFRTLRFTHRLAEERVPELPQRLRVWADQIVALEQRCPAAELELVGHSCGSFVAVMLAAELRRRPEAAALVQRLSLLTLGHNIPHLALLPAARPFRADLAQLLEQPRLPWRDWSSADDWLCFAGVNPLAVVGLADGAGNYPEQLLLPLANRRGIPAGLQGFWGRLSQQFQLHFDYWQWLPRAGSGSCCGSARLG